MTRWLPRLALVALLTTLASSALAEATKLDIAARIAIYNLRQGTSASDMREAGIMAATEEGEIDCFIVGNVTRAELEAAGARIRTALPGIFTAFIPLSAVDAVSAIAGVQKIEGAQIEEVEHDASVPTTNAHLFRGAGPTFTGLNGAGVLLGNVDTGVDYSHDDFKDALGNSRILKIWDQTNAVGPAPAPYGYGTDWNQAQLNANISTAGDTHGHGSHTMGSIAGDGSAIAGGSAPAFTYAGMAPMADIVVVDGSTTGSFSNTSMIDGISYIFQTATTFGKPAVANLSIGGSFGPHDGSSTFEAAVDAMTGLGRSVVFSSGNNRGDQQHAEINAAPGGGVITMSCLNGAVLNRRFQINGWYNATEIIDVTVTTPNGTVIGPITLGNMNAAYPGTPTANGAVYVENGVTLSTNGSRQIIIDVINQNAAAQNLTGTWTYTFTAIALGPDLGEVDLWRNFQSNTALAANFVIGNDSNFELVNAISTGFNTFSTASWTSKRFWTDCDGTPNINFGGAVNPGPISPFSSMGPTRDDRNKPNLAAPGSAIASVNSQDYLSTCPAAATALLPGLMHVMNQGTSMAAPHMTGAIGLVFQKYGYMSVADVRTFLESRALTDGFTGAVWNKDFGWGKLFLGDMSDPLCTVTSPNGGEVLIIGDNVNLTWNASDAYAGVTAVDIELSRTGVGGPYTAIATGIANSGSYLWNVTGPITNNAILRVTARDAALNAGVDVSDQEWAIADPPVATTIATFRAEATAEGVRLVWQFTEPSELARVAVERAVSSQGPWAELAAELSREGETTVALDRTAEAGQTYFYRLAVTYTHGGNGTFGPLTATGGEPITEFALKGVVPNPTEGPALIEYAVPRATDVNVALYDLQGREVAVLASGAHPVGRFQVTWSGEVDGGPARAGIYFLRLTANGFAQTRRIVVSH